MKKWKQYTSKEIKPAGWLKKQLEIQAEGLSGHLDKVWRDVRDSKWIGGDAEGWERVPYWLDGFIPLAYLLEDDDMISRAKRYISAIVSSQRETVGFALVRRIKKQNMIPGQYCLLQRC